MTTNTRGHLACPRCGEEMEVKGVQGIAIDRCPNCFGIWFDKGELESIEKGGGGDMVRLLSMGSPFDDADMSQPWNDLSREDERAHAECPRCSAAMERHEDGIDRTLIVDRCKACGGTWYDGGEAARHLEAIRDEGVFAYLKRIIFK